MPFGVDHGQQRPQPDQSHLPIAIRLVYGGELTLVFAAVVIGVIPSLLYLGPLSDRAGRRPLLVVALALALAGALAFTLASGLGGLLVARALQSVAFGALSGTAVAALVELEPAGDHARSTLVATATMSRASDRAARRGTARAVRARSGTPYVLRLVGASACIADVDHPDSETVSRSARAAGGRGQRIGVPAAIRAPFLVASVAVIASFGALGLVAALGPKFVASLLHVDNRAVGGAVVFAMLSASAIAQLAARAWIARRLLIACATSLAFGLLTLVGGVATRSLATFVLGVVIAGVGQGLAYLGAQSPARQRRSRRSPRRADVRLLSGAVYRGGRRAPRSRREQQAARAADRDHHRRHLPDVADVLFGMFPFVLGPKSSSTATR